MTLTDLRAAVIAHSVGQPSTLEEALERLGFVQADPIRAPARAQDLTLRHRVVAYRAGDLDRAYPHLAVEEEHFINYGFLLRRHVRLLYPRSARRPWDAQTRRRAAELLAFVREQGEVHPEAADASFRYGAVTNYWGGASRASTHLLDAMHYVGLLRVARRERGVRVYALRDDASPAVAGKRPKETRAARTERARALVRLVVDTYAPVPAPSLGGLVGRLRYAAPQLRDELGAELRRARQDLPRATIGDVTWFWPDGVVPITRSTAVRDAEPRVRLFAPFDPVVWDRARFEVLWGWPYRFEAYTPAAQRQRGYYALPLAFEDDMVGWANVTGSAGDLHVDVGHVEGRGARLKRDPSFRRALDAEIARLRAFL